MRAAFILFALVASCYGASVLQKGRSFVSLAQCWAGSYQSGETHIFNDNMPYLAAIDFDNTIESVKVTGMWMFYNEEAYSAHDQSYMCYVHGIDYFMNLPPACSNMATSIRYACHPYELNGDCWSVYDLTFFRGESMYGLENIPDLSYLSHKVSSIIITGKSPWTFCTGVFYTGHCVCLFPDTVHDNGNMQRFDLGIYEELPQFGEDRIVSVHKGCGGGGKDIINSSIHRLNLKQHEKGGYGVMKLY